MLSRRSGSLVYSSVAGLFLVVSLFLAGGCRIDPSVTPGGPDMPPAGENSDPSPSADNRGGEPPDNGEIEPSENPGEKQMGRLAPPRITVRGIFPESLAGRASVREVVPDAPVTVAGDPGITVTYRFAAPVDPADFRLHFNLRPSLPYSINREGQAISVTIDPDPLLSSGADGTVPPVELSLLTGLPSREGSALDRPVALTLNLKKMPAYTAWLEGGEGFTALPLGTYAVEPDLVLAHITFNKPMRRESVEYYVRWNLTTASWPARETMVDFIWVDERHALVKLRGLWPGRRYSITPAGALDVDGLPLQGTTALRILAARAAGELWRVPPTGKMERVMTINTWPDGADIGSGSRLMIWEYRASAGETWPARPVIIDITTGQRRSPAPFDQYNSYQWSPAGDSLLLTTTSKVLLAPLNGGTPETLIALDAAQGQDILGARLSPDRRLLAYIVTGREDQSTPALVVRDLSTGGEETYPNLMRPLAADVNGADLTWTPDGGGVILTEYDDTGLQGRVFRLNLADGTRRLLAGNALEPRLSPDGNLLFVKTITLGTQGRSAGSTSYIITPQGKTMLPTENRYTAIAWSADSRRLLLRVERNDPEGRGTEQGIGIWDWESRILSIIPAAGEPLGWDENGNLWFLTFGEGISAPPWVREHNAIATERLFLDPAVAAPGSLLRVAIPEEVPAQLLKDAELTLVTAQGMIVAAKESPAPGGEETFDLSGLAPGPYHIILRRQETYGPVGLEMATFWIEP